MVRIGGDEYDVFEGDIPDGYEMSGDLAIDTETLGLNILRDRLCLLQMCDSKGKVAMVKFSDPACYDAPNLKKLLMEKGRVKIFHYARFDVAIIYRYLGVMLEDIFCTKIASKLTRTYTDSHGLKSVCREIAGVELDKEYQSSDWGADKLNRKQLKYAANDVVYLHELRDNFLVKLKTSDRLEIAKSCFDFLANVCLMDLQGFLVESILCHR